MANSHVNETDQRLLRGIFLRDGLKLDWQSKLATSNSVSQPPDSSSRMTKQIYEPYAIDKNDSQATSRLVQYKPKKR